MSKHISIYILLFIVSFSPSFAQSGADNPFNLIPRVEADKAAKRAAGEGTFVPSNPFDIMRKTESLPTMEETAAQNISEQEKEYINIAAEKEEFSRFFFTAFMGMLLLLTLTFIIFRTSFAKTRRAFLNDNMMTQIHREQGAIAHLSYVLMNFLFCINLALFILLALRHYEISLPYGGTWHTFFALTGGIMSIFIGKHILLKVIASIYPLKKELSLYAFTITIFCAVLGFVLIPLNAALAYAPDETARLVILLSAGVIGLTYLFRSLRGLVIGGRYIGSDLFHFLLYICIVEIVPTAILFKYVSGA